MQGIFLLLLLISFAHADEIYRWRDAKGHVHYSGSIPQNQSYEQVNSADLPFVHSVVAPVDVSQSSGEVKQQKKSRSAAKPRRVKNDDRIIRQCRHYREQLETIGNRLREGYREPVGNRLRAKRRQIEQRLRDEC